MGSYTRSLPSAQRVGARQEGGPEAGPTPGATTGTAGPTRPTGTVGLADGMEAEAGMVADALGRVVIETPPT